MSEETSKTVTSKSVADKIWSEIKGKKLDLFSLPDETVEKVCSKVEVEPSKLYLKLKASAALAALDTALSDRYVVQPEHKYITVSYK